MNFVNRINEQKRLNDLLNADKSSFTVVYGRRRLGKSTLLKKVLTDNDVYYLADQTEAALQIETLAKMLAVFINDFDKVIYPDYKSLFLTLNDRVATKFTLCLDEFPYLVQSAPELPSILQNLFDSKQLKFNIIICGSSQQLMYGLVLDASSPLYGRADAIIKINPIKIPYLKEALNLDDINTIEEYAVWGGVPRYWELREAQPNFPEAIKNNLLSVNGILYEEPIKLFKEDFKDIVKTATLMSYIGAGVNRLSELASRCGEPATNLSRPLSKLIELGYITRETAFGEPERNAKRSLYKISDQLISFYYRFVAPYKSFIELDRITPINNILETQFSHFVSEYFEKLCREAVTANEINGITYGVAKRWWGTVGKNENIEIDVIAESLDKKYLLVGECKYTNSENSDRLLFELQQKINKLPFASNYTVIPILFLKYKPTGEFSNYLLPRDIVGLSSLLII